MAKTKQSKDYIPNSLSGRQAGRSVPESSSDPLPFFVAVVVIVAASTAVVSLANLATFPLPCLVRCAIFVFE